MRYIYKQLTYPCLFSKQTVTHCLKSAKLFFDRLADVGFADVSLKE